MAARAGMMALIAELRSMTRTNENDYTVGGLAYWTDDQLQARLDAVRASHYRVMLIDQPRLVDNAYEWLEYSIPTLLGRWIEGQGTDSGWRVATSAGSTLDEALYNVNLPAHVITFNAEQNGAIRMLDCRSYNLNLAAARIWREKAAAAAVGVDWQSDNHRISASQLYTHCIEMAESFERQSGAGFATSSFMRVDEC